MSNGNGNVNGNVNGFGKLRLLDIVMIVVVVMCLGAGAFAIARVESEAHKRCIDGQLNREAIRDTLKAGLLVGAKGQPGFAYYQAHPDELLAARQSAKDALKRFPPVECPS